MGIRNRPYHPTRGVSPHRLLAPTRVTSVAMQFVSNLFKGQTPSKENEPNLASLGGTNISTPNESEFLTPIRNQVHATPAEMAASTVPTASEVATPAGLENVQSDDVNAVYGSGSVTEAEHSDIGVGVQALRFVGNLFNSPQHNEQVRIKTPEKPERKTYKYSLEAIKQAAEASERKRNQRMAIAMMEEERERRMSASADSPAAKHASNLDRQESRKFAVRAQERVRLK